MNLRNIKWKWLLYFSGIALIFAVIKILEIKFKFSDEFTYIYMGQLLLHGLIPYRDFFFASPPLQIYLMAAGKILVGNHLLLLKLIPIFSTLGSSFFIYNFMKKKFNRLYGLTASTLFLFSFLILLTTDYSTGIDIVVFFILGSIYFIEEDKPLIAGIFSSLALLTRLYAAFPIVGVCLYYVILKKKGLLKFLVGTVSLFLPISIIFQIISHGDYLNQIFFFRLNLVSGIGLPKFDVIKFFVLGDFILILGTLFYLIFDREKKELALPLLAAAFSIILYAVYSDIYYLYFGLIIGFLAIFTTKMIFRFENSRNFKKILFIFLLFFILFNSYFYITKYGTAANITFTEDIVNFVKSNSLENQTIYGSFEITPLIGILANRNLAGNIADTNPKNIMTDTFTIKEIEEKIKGVKFIIAKVIILEDGSIVGSDASIPLGYLKENCNLTKTYPIINDFSSNAIVIYDCKKPTSID